MPRSTFAPFGSTRFSTPPKDAPVADAAAADHFPGGTRMVARHRYRRSPFYLKIDGLTGPRPVYDERGRLVEDGV